MRRLCPPEKNCMYCSDFARHAAEDAKPIYGKSIKLSVAGLCANCDSIVDRLDTCPDCGSTSLMNLARVLDRGAA